MSPTHTHAAAELLDAGKTLIRSAYRMQDADIYDWPARYESAKADAGRAQRQASQALDALDLCPDCEGLGYVCTYYRTGQMDEPEYDGCPSGCPDTRRPPFFMPRRFDQPEAPRMNPCPTCRRADGSVNAAYLHQIGSCVFGCGATIDPDFGWCGRCKDHSANRAECETCGTAYEDWSGKWEAV